MEWELRQVEESEAILDDSGVYVVVHRIERTETHKEYSGTRVSVRADVMQHIDDGCHPPASAAIMSFQGTANAVRKALIRFCRDTDGITYRMSLEHASYIGYELLRAETTKNYVQD